VGNADKFSSVYIYIVYLVLISIYIVYLVLVSIYIVYLVLVSIYIVYLLQLLRDKFSSMEYL
jgi:cellulose synthase/poly-beta-1,6-N-acetylglucosamine synthase-like glycosyltransferase